MFSNEGLSRKRRAAPSFLDPRGERAGRSPDLGVLTRKCGFATFLDPRGGRAGRSPDLDVLMRTAEQANEVAAFRPSQSG